MDKKVHVFLLLQCLPAEEDKHRRKANMRYLGSKNLMTNRILEVIETNTDNAISVTDIFSGTGVVAKTLKSHGFSVIANDLLYFSYALNKGLLETNKPLSKKMHELIEHLNNLPTDCNSLDHSKAFIYNNYSPHDGCNRMYFQNSNALKIDAIRHEIEKLRPELQENEYFYLLACLINAVPYVANITGTYAAYLKYWDKRTYNPLKLDEEPIIASKLQHHCYNMDAFELAKIVISDIVYLDPPYNQRQYLPNYHILETIAKYDYPEIKGVTGIRTDPHKQSVFCKKAIAADSFKKLLDQLNCKYILISYNNEGIISTEQLTEIVCSIGIPKTFKLFEYDYRRYKSKIPNTNEGLKEQLYFIQKS